MWSDKTDAILRSTIVAQAPARQAIPLAKALIHLLQSPQYQATLAQTGHAFVEPLSWPSIAQQHENIYQQLIPLAGQTRFQH